MQLTLKEINDLAMLVVTSSTRAMLNKTPVDLEVAKMAVRKIVQLSNLAATTGHGNADGWRKLPAMEAMIISEDQRLKRGADMRPYLFAIDATEFSRIIMDPDTTRLARDILEAGNKAEIPHAGHMLNWMDDAEWDSHGAQYRYDVRIDFNKLFAWMGICRPDVLRAVVPPTHSNPSPVPGV